MMGAGVEMDEAERWADRGRRAQQGIGALGFMIGSWRGTGQSHGAQVSAVLEVRPRLDGSWLEATETVYDADGVPEHTDLSLYRYDPEEGRLEVLHLMDHATFHRHPVEPVGEALHWITGPMAPRLAILPQAEGFRMEVHYPSDAAPVVTIDYRPA
jgi:hypothetical protein